MALVNVVVRDGSNAAIPGGVRFIDVSGTGVGPHVSMHALVDAAGTNLATVGAGGALKVDGSAVTQPVSLASGAATSAKQDILAALLPASLGAKLGSASLSIVHATDDALVQAIAAEDSASADADKGVRILARRTATPANTSGADLDYEMLQMSNGHLWVYSEGGVAAGATDSGNPVKVGAKYNTTPPIYTDGQRGDLQVGSRGSLKVSLIANDAVTAADITTPGDALSNSVGALIAAGYSFVFNGTSWDRNRGDTTSGAWVNVKASALPSGAATSAKQDALAALFPATLGQKAMAASLAVVLASDQSTVPVSLASVPSHAVTLAAGATSIGKAEDVASADADVGVPAMAIRKATPANTSGAAGDYEMLQMLGGRLWVSNASASIDDAADVTLTNGSETVLVAQDDTRAEVTIVSDPTNTVNIRIGKTGQVGSARGALLQPGHSITLLTKAAVYGFASAASQKVSLVILKD